MNTLADPRTLQNDWSRDPNNPENILRQAVPNAISDRKPSPVPPDIRHLIRDEQTKLKSWLLSMGISPEEYNSHMLDLAEKAAVRVSRVDTPTK